MTLLALSIFLGVLLSVPQTHAQRFDPSKQTEEACEKGAAHLERAVAPSIKATEITQAVISNAPGCYLFLSSDWNYEICVNQYIRQFRTDGKSYVVAENYLGFAHRIDEIGGNRIAYEKTHRTVKQSIDAAFRADTITSAKFSKNRPECKDFNVVSKFTGGTMCPATKQPREASVRFLCTPSDAEELPDMMTQIVEVSTCKYEVFIAGKIACSLLGNQYEMRNEEFQTLFGPILETAKNQRENARIALEKESARLLKEAESISEGEDPTAEATAVESVVDVGGLEPTDQSFLWSTELEANTWSNQIDLYSYFGGMKGDQGESEYNVPLSV